MTDLTYAYSILSQLDEWIEELASPIIPPRRIDEGEGYFRLEFQQHLPHTVMIGKLVRAASGIRAAFALSESGYVAESGAILRIVSDLCAEIGAIGGALNRGGELPKEVRDFVDQYFMPKQQTPEAYAAAERIRYVSREHLMKSDIAAGTGTAVDVKRVLSLRRFLNMRGDAVHGAYKTTMELCEPRTGRFFLGGHPDGEIRHTHLEYAALKLHEVVVAVELTGAVTSTAPVFDKARNTRREMDRLAPWKLENPLAE